MNRSSIAENASLYDKTPYKADHIEPDTISYSAKFYAKTHIPSLQNRHGNNTINDTVYTKYSPEYNLYCLK